MGKKTKRKLKCSICKSIFPSFKSNSRDVYSHRTHRNTNGVCKEVQERLRREHVERGNSDELNFDCIDDEEMCSVDNSSNVDEDEDEEGGDGDEEEEDEDDDDDDNDDDDVEERESLDDNFEGEFNLERRFEDREYDVREAMEEEAKEREEEVHFDFTVAEGKRSPRDKSFWTNPQQQLIGVHVKKDFEIHGVFSRVIESYEKPYYKVRYTDNDCEEFTFAKVIKQIDLDLFNVDSEQ